MEKGFYVVLESDLILDNRISETSKILYAIICFYSNNEKGYCFLNHTQLMKIINKKKRRFYYCLDELKKYNYITIKKSKNRSYLMPVINVIQEIRKNNPEKIKEIFDYNWLDEE